MDKITLYGRSSKNKIKQLSIWTEIGGYVCREWGYQNGKMQVTKDLVKQKNVGKSNETSLDEQADLEAQRLLNKKLDEGYSTDINKTNDAKIDWDNVLLPKTFAAAKPATKISPKKEKELVEEDRARYTRKFNGMRVFCIHGKSGVKIFSRRLEDKTPNFKWLAKEIEKCTKPGMVLDGELQWNDDPDLIKTVFGSKPEKAIERQKGLPKSQLPCIIFFDILYRNFKPLSEIWDERYTLVRTYIPDNGVVNLFPVSILKDKSELQDSWEGLVLWDATSTTNIRFDGKPDRKSGAYKIKSFKECDLICYEWMTGKGRLSDMVATLKLGVYDKEGNLVHICESGSGLDGDSRAEILKLSPDKKTKFCVEIKYEEFTKAGSLRLPIFLRTRTDKNISECTLESLNV